MQPTEPLSQFYTRNPGHIVPGSDARNKALGHINVFTRESCASVTPYSRRDYYKVSLVIGTGKLYYADKWVYIDRPAMLFSNPVVPYAWEAESEVQSGWYCLFTEAFVQHNERMGSLQDSPLFRTGGSPVFFPDETQLQEISAIFRKMMTEIGSGYVHKHDVLRSYLHLLIHEAMRANPADNYHTYSNASQRVSALFLELLERQFPIDAPERVLALKTPADFAGALSVHVNHLNRSVKEVTGKTTGAHIAARITAEASALLQHTDWNISDIAYSLGFEYPSYFSIFFKKHTGMAPQQLREMAV
ncbi:helix-turn-helix transcriptional regulator [Chitinophaga horti]|uniref:Helix-turn-helix transcriptional regulator n=1 Tax=Chitinophaga horti TaxID=2920382 RepID=A0ABY6JBL6_9BACT|nr:AraC family transcriptional regulator [Chitinophaga horti]UYQ95574.1 helix-turn-helix transcriptional regulator [Chitinophaga horti]